MENPVKFGKGEPWPETLC